MFELRVLTDDDVAFYRTIRLRALSSDPQAFGSTFERESMFDDQTWRARVLGFHGQPGVVHLAVSEAGASIGVAGVGLTPEETTSAYLWGMWVAPEARGSGVSRELVAACIGWARIARASDIRLDVKLNNARAIALYLRMGFAHAGLVPGGDACAGELRMVCPLQEAGA